MKLARLSLIGVVVFAVAATATSAVGYFVAGGRGTGTATVGVLEGTTTELQESASVPDPLYPGGRGDLVLSVRNPNAYAIAVEAVEPSTTATVTSDVEGCGDYVRLRDERIAISPAAELTAGGTLVLPLRDAVEMLEDAPSECQGARFVVPVVVAVRR